MLESGSRCFHPNASRLSLNSKEHIMANIVIKDLPENVELDREAMLAVVGGSRRSGSRNPVGSTIFRTNRIVTYPAGFVGRSLPEKSKPGSKPG
jgi:hypothetical protein